MDLSGRTGVWLGRALAIIVVIVLLVFILGADWWLHLARKLGKLD